MKKTIEIELMQDFSEIVRYEHTGIPLYIRTADLSIYPGKSAPCHFLCILFHPSLFGGNKILLQNYVTPVIENSDCEYLHFYSKQKRGQEIAEYLEQIRCLKDMAASAYEMQVIAVMFQLWSSLLQFGELLSKIVKATVTAIWKFKKVWCPLFINIMQNQ